MKCSIKDLPLSKDTQIIGIYPEPLFVIPNDMTSDRFFSAHPFSCVLFNPEADINQLYVDIELYLNGVGIYAEKLLEYTNHIMESRECVEWLINLISPKIHDAFNSFSNDKNKCKFTSDIHDVVSQITNEKHQLISSFSEEYSVEMNYITIINEIEEVENRVTKINIEAELQRHITVFEKNEFNIDDELIEMLINESRILLDKLERYRLIKERAKSILRISKTIDALNACLKKFMESPCPMIAGK